ncbi:dihydrofolate reductase family protein [Phytohabitans suffuscus]|uniref:Deaminase n=1 Tax=Phytohabitans suffuscus TaxID=624315 RepID=A0A6F8YDQ4_9ACTN|nr:dihydrofolate reductase family protein [Phytohabitans suffuscus]BCB84190.1 deaminase [Phytohabitans suffuscus]
MAKMLYAATMSLDGFIAGPGGDMSWLKPYFGPNPEMDGLVHRIGALLVGRRTHEGDDPNRGTENEGAFGGTWNGPTFVLTHRPPADPVPGVTFVDDLERAVAAAREAAGDRYVNILGADVARSCLDAGQLDEILVCVAPVLLGEGTRLFERPGGDNVPLERIHLSHGQLATNIWTRVLPR